MQPYVVSQDVSLLIKKWTAHKGLIMPSDNFFIDLRFEFNQEMIKMFPAYEVVSEEELSLGMADIVAGSSAVPVILDQVYSNGERRVDMTRLVDRFGQDAGVGPRAGSLPLCEQLERLRDCTEIILVDDVVFQGESLSFLVGQLRSAGIVVREVCAGIALAEGVQRLREIGCNVKCVRLYDKLIDEVCERDFFPGVPFSGRQLAGENNCGVPYILPFGHPQQWASIPPKFCKCFSIFCIEQTIHLFEEIERVSDTIITCTDLARGVIMLPQNNMRFVDMLHQVKIVL